MLTSRPHNHNNIGEYTQNIHLLCTVTEQAKKIDMECAPLFEGLLSMETNPVPIKEALAITGLMTNELRLPLIGLSNEKHDQLTRMLQKMGLAN